MDTLRSQVARARRRLVIQQFLGVLVWCLFATLLVAALAIGMQKIWLVGIDGWQWAASWLGGAVVLGLLAAIVWTRLFRLPELDAAIELDRRFGLKERVSSALALQPEELDTSAGRALMDDTLRRVRRLEVDERFPVTVSRRAWLPLVPAIAAFALCFLADPTRSDQGDANANTVAITKLIKESIDPLRKKAEERRQQAGEQGLKEAEELLKKLEEGTRDLAKKDQSDQHDALSKLNDLAKELEQRRDKLAEGEKFKEQLAAMKNLPTGPADKLAQDLKNGDLNKALKELEKLKQELASGKLDPQKQKELTDQMNAMKDALQKTADAHQKMQEKLKQQIEKANKAGDQQLAKNLQQQLKQLQQQQPQMNQLKDLANKFGQCAQSMKQGDTGQAQAALNQMAAELAQMQQEAAEMQMLDGALSEIDEAKSAMSGSGNCPGGNELGQQKNAGISFSDHGKAEGAEGPRPEKAHDTKLYDTKVKQDVGKGSFVVNGLVQGPNAKGQVMEEIKGQVEAAKRESEDPLTGQRLPRQQRDHVQQYFDAFRKGGN